MYLKHAGATQGRHRRLFDEAEGWIENTDTRWPFSFENVCVLLDLEAEYVRRGLRAAKARARTSGGQRAATSSSDSSTSSKAA
jgi:hypothetical protein